jgi:peptidoglycan/xylan/chitin deacetylase (PgdA/CDA1 family)
MNVDQILEMNQSGLVEFGAHSMTHARLTELSLAELERQVRNCKRSLEDLLGKPVFSFAYPYGFFNDEVKKAVAEAGYVFGIAVEWGPNHFGDDLLEIRRICLSPDAGKLEFLWKTSFLYPSFRRCQRRLKQFGKKG